jgi:hypothetical protein
LLGQVYELADQRTLEKTTFDRALASDNPDVLKAALMSLGRIGGTQAAARIAPFLEHASPEIRQTAAMALGIAGDQSQCARLLQGFKQEGSVAVKNELLLAMGTLGVVEGLDIIQQALKQPATASSAAQAIVLLVTWHPEAVSALSVDTHILLTLAIRADDTAISAAYALSRLTETQTDYSEATLVRAIEQAANERARSLLIKAWGKRRGSRQWQAILQFLNSNYDYVVIESLRALAGHNRILPVAEGLLENVLSDSAHIAVTALESLLSRRQEQTLQTASGLASVAENIGAPEKNSGSGAVFGNLEF